MSDNNQGAEKKQEQVISDESAEKLLDRFLDYYEIDITNIVSKNIKNSAKQAYANLHKAITRGRLDISFTDGVEVIQTLKYPPGDMKTITYKKLTGQAKTSMKEMDNDDVLGQVYALMGSLSGLGAKGLSKLEHADIKIVENLGVLFLLP